MKLGVILCFSKSQKLGLTRTPNLQVRWRSRECQAVPNLLRSQLPHLAPREHRTLTWRYDILPAEYRWVSRLACPRAMDRNSQGFEECRTRWSLFPSPSNELQKFPRIESRISLTMNFSYIISKWFPPLDQGSSCRGHSLTDVMASVC